MIVIAPIVATKKSKARLLTSEDAKRETSKAVTKTELPGSGNKIIIETGH